MDRRVFSGALSTLILVGSVYAQDALKEPPALKAARTRFESESREAQETVQRNYRTRLEELQQDLKKKGDKDGVQAVKAELTRLRASKKEGRGAKGEPGRSRGRGPDLLDWVQGIWTVRYEGGGHRTYVINGDGSVDFLEEKKTGRIFREGNQLWLDFGDDKAERLDVKTVIKVDHFSPKAVYAAGGKPTLTGTAERKGARPTP